MFQNYATMAVFQSDAFNCVPKGSLYQRAQSKGTWTCRKSNFIREFSGRMPLTKTATTVFAFCASLPSRNAHRHVTRVILCESCQGKCRRPRSRKIRGAGFVLICAVEMHMDMSQEKSYVRICRKQRQTVGAP